MADAKTTLGMDGLSTVTQISCNPCVRSIGKTWEGPLCLQVGERSSEQSQADTDFASRQSRWGFPHSDCGAVGNAMGVPAHPRPTPHGGAHRRLDPEQRL
uniref:Uncharacterized protein n=1 Tax=Chromera velia CCMP2878 TaxID=1169474 RepID=A0A0G4GSJ3_9ALVE|eukprot:Cvel_23135.t1-p1 / transcript=Cvel_23135.t1 / gene=Cvel_23135 / organism=Chromera_velia_CCMP2878 / gene_product=hypothetical protein / transcript_product=hypothetical protein / location=Cvel_scaffold2351:15623-17576(-) / protein_length=99 / sequence_SO=supercontig / SO=protein_coding / is_pseudo=false